jgi:putative hydrolase of the HAD superfamily
MTDRRPSFVLFDLGNVLVHIHPEAFLQVLGIDTPENRRFYQPFVNTVVLEYERGDTSTEEFLGRLEILFNAREGEHSRHARQRPIARDELRKAMLAVIGRPVSGMEGLVRRVATNVRVGLLSNTNPLHFDSCVAELPTLRFIPTRFLSYQLKSLKPDPTIFRKVTALLMLDPSDIIYIDDMPVNIESARSVGLTSLLFEGPEVLERHLSELRLS